MRMRALSVVVALTALVSACAEVDSAGSRPPDLGIGGVGAGGGGGGSGAAGADMVVTTVGGAADMTVASSSGGCSPACAGGQLCVGGACACPPYQAFCNGQVAVYGSGQYCVQKRPA